MNIEQKFKFIEDQKKEMIKTKGYKRILSLFDVDTFSEIGTFVKSSNEYAEVITGYGLIDNHPTYAFSQEYGRDGGAISKAHLKKIKNIFDLSSKTGIPVVGIYDSIGAKLNEGPELLYEYGEVLKLSNNLSGVVPKVSIILGTCLGTNAILASSSDYIIMEKSSRLGISTVDENSSAEVAERDGIFHILAINEIDAINNAKQLISMFPLNNLSQPTREPYKEEISSLVELNAIAKNMCNSDDSELMKKIVVSICDSKSFIDLQPKYGMSMITGFGRIGGKTIGIVASNTYKDGIIDAQACAKSSRMVRFCDAFSIPIITIINSKGFLSLKEATKLSCVYSEATTVKVNLIVGTAYGSVYMTIAGNGSNPDATIAWPTAIISSLEPKTMVQVLLNSRMKDFKDPINDKRELIMEYEETQASAFIAASNALVDHVICPENTRSELLSILDFLEGKRVATLPKKHSNVPL